MLYAPNLSNVLFYQVKVLMFYDVQTTNLTIVGEQ